MKTKILLIGLTIFLVNVISVNAKETIITCSDNYIVDGWNFSVFPKDGGKPYGSLVEELLTFTNPLNLEVIFEQEKDYNNCLNKMRKGKVDILSGLGDKDDQGDYMHLIPYYRCPESWKCKGNGHINLGISKKSKFASRVDEFKSVILSNDDYAAINNTKFTSADQHNWDWEKSDYLVKDTLKICLQNEQFNKDKFVYVKFANKKAYGVYADAGAYYANKLGLKPEYVNGIHNFEESCHVCINCSDTLHRKHYLHSFRPKWKKVLCW